MKNWLIIGIVAFVLIAAIVVYYILNKNKKEKVGLGDNVGAVEDFVGPKDNIIRDVRPGANKDISVSQR